jgi:hypothetical protein
MVVLDRNGEVMTGRVGTWPARTVRIEIGGASRELAVIGGHFLVPVRMVGPEGTPVTVTLLGEDGQSLAIVTLVPPGAAEPTPAD